MRMRDKNDPLPLEDLIDLIDEASDEIQDAMSSLEIIKEEAAWFDLAAAEKLKTFLDTFEQAKDLIDDIKFFAEKQLDDEDEHSEG